jgi:hypothetical protein
MIGLFVVDCAVLPRPPGVADVALHLSDTHRGAAESTPRRPNNWTQSRVFALELSEPRKRLSNAHVIHLLDPRLHSLVRSARLGDTVRFTAAGERGCLGVAGGVNSGRPTIMVSCSRYARLAVGVVEEVAENRHGLLRCLERPEVSGVEEMQPTAGGQELTDLAALIEFVRLQGISSTVKQ